MTYHLDPRMPAPDQCIQRYMLERWTKAQPDKVFAVFQDGETWTYADTLREAITTANALKALGVKQGERVLCWLPNSADCLRAWFGLNMLGAVFVPINLAYRGNLLRHAVKLSEARLGLIHADLHQRLGEIELGRLEEIVVLGGAAQEVPGLKVHQAEAFKSADTTAPALEREIAPWDMQSIIFTSGTTGPSKGVMSSYMHLYSMAKAAPFLRSDERYMVNLPMFHSGGVMPVTAMLIHGGSIVMVDAFDTNTFWDTIRQRQITTVILLGVMGGFLLKRPPSPDDKNHTLRTCTYVPLNDTAPQFHERFGTEVHTHFNMTEISMPIVSDPNPTALGSAGKARKGVEVRIVDENDCEVPVGATGELVVRTECPWALNHGYAGNPEATAAAWRNGWFHTGDGFRKDAEGNFYFVDRLKDAIRRRGENISSFEVESEVLSHPAVREAAAVAVKSEIAEDEVMAVVALKEGVEFDPAELIEFLRPRMAHFMIPRYVRVVDGLPRTPTAKIEKVKLREAGITDDTWDRDAAGIRIKREKVGLKSA
ncbi:AMP-binding protein [Mesorhizobium australicum]|uniref:Crotonobetaine/carnitine-CoA ligase n=1 Tax=Mesorhizobium australicum TaxID=536018 RepID=A0A1X7PK22_9HYPH|nr:AMP-binding protein [Mesorhizobium australicum]SMH51829.1 crotonobetaine/carnitine-CoA ligase [Mesorhizobium australicum]